MKNKLVWLVPALLGLVVITLSFNNHYSQKQVQTLKVDNQRLQKHQEADQEQNGRFESQSTHSYDWAKQKASDFNQTYYNFSDQKSYQEREKKLSNLLNLSEKNQKKVFDSGLDRTGGSVIDNLGLKSQLMQNDAYIANVGKEDIELFSFAQTKVSSAGRDDGTAYHLVHLWVNQSSKKIDDIKLNQLKD
ncbi:hypothetical protein [Fructobacillus cardui]|uniref:hypothetical protein n=1 Tax=Fructobacillus cardui TaxID=2893170 RepID=UPI002D82B461|nr:hypothetical protein R53653_IHELHDKM_00728 [Fructobacillus cardui]